MARALRILGAAGVVLAGVAGGAYAWRGSGGLAASPRDEAPAARSHLPDGGLRIEALPPQISVTVGRPVVLPARQVEHGSPPFVRRLSGGDGVALGELGTIAVAPAVAGFTGPYTLTVTDAEGRAGSTQMFVLASPPLRLSEPRRAPATVGEPFRAAFSAAGGRPPYAWSFSGQPPEGLAFVNGVLEGTPAAVGTTAGLVVTVADADGRQAYSGSLSIEVSDRLTVQSLPAEVEVTRGHPLSLPPPAVSGGVPPYARTLLGPPGASLGDDGSVNLAAGTAGKPADLRLVVRDSQGRIAATAARVASVEPMRMGPYAGAVLARGVEARVDGVAVSGGRGAVRLTLLDDATGAEAAPPRGLGFSGEHGALAGIPEEAGSYGPYRIRASEAGGRSVDGLAFSIRVVEPREASASTRREVLVDGRRHCSSASAGDCQRAGDFRTVEIRYPELVRVNELAFGCDYAAPPAGVWEVHDGRRWAAAEATDAGPCTALVPTTAVTAVRFTRLAGAFSRLWAPRAVLAR